jgi:hypothetical protein
MEVISSIREGTSDFSKLSVLEIGEFGEFGVEKMDEFMVGTFDYL